VVSVIGQPWSCHLRRQYLMNGVITAR
jgi:hypothetical protein